MGHPWDDVGQQLNKMVAHGSTASYQLTCLLFTELTQSEYFVIRDLLYQYNRRQPGTHGHVHQVHLHYRPAPTHTGMHAPLPCTCFM